MAIPAPILAECWACGAFGCDNPQSLVSTVMLHLQSSFGTRSRAELWNMTNSNVVLGPLRDDAVPQYLTFHERIAKNRRGLKGQGAREVNPKMYPDDSRPERCGVHAFMLYQSKKPLAASIPEYKLWVNCKNQSKDWKDIAVWYSTQHMGTENIGKIIYGKKQSIGVDIKLS